MQTSLHKLLSANDPQGWDNQINNELVFKLEAQRIWHLYMHEGNNRQFDILGLWGAGIGNLESATKAGFAIRWGTNLQYSFPTFSLQADRQVNPLALTPANNFYIFLGGRAGWVFNNILIDGNSFRDSHSVPLEHFQDQISSSIVWSVGSSSFVFQLSSISSSTTVVDDRETFGALSITYRY